MRDPNISGVVSEAMSSESAARRLKTVRAQLSSMLARGQFTTACAVDGFSAAIHWIVWDHVKDRPDARSLYREFKRSRRAPGMAEGLAAEFKTQTGAYDQRKPRRLLRFVLGP